jgi:hypothetical protein
VSTSGGSQGCSFKFIEKGVEKSIAMPQTVIVQKTDERDKSYAQL